jgi:signal peptidase I
MALQVLALAFISVAFFVRAPQVSGFSMAPLIASGEVVVINTAAYKIGSVHRGDIVAFTHDRGAPIVYLKRVVGMPGESVALRDGFVFVDGRRLAEPYVRFRDDRSVAPLRLPAGAYYVLGDNRTNSDDSRDWGGVASSEIIGKAVVGIWPPSHLGVL